MCLFTPFLYLCLLDSIFPWPYRLADDPVKPAVPEAVPLGGKKASRGTPVVKLRLPTALERGCRPCSPGLLARRQSEPPDSLPPWALWLSHPGSGLGGWTRVPGSCPGTEGSHGHIEHMASEVSWGPQKNIT